MSAARGLHRRHARNELGRDLGINAALVVMIALSACLMATGAMVMERLVGAIDDLFEQARPPHFLQMHKGDYDVEALERFAAAHPEIESWFVSEMIGFDGAALTWQRPATGEAGDFSDSLIDNLFVSQSPDFDLLLDLDGGTPHPGGGEVYVPVAWMQRYGLTIGDLLLVTTATGVHEFTIEGFVRDSQMASSLSAAARFVVSEGDREALEEAGGGAPEVIVEYRLTDGSLAADLERAYTSDASLPMNGEAVTWTMIRTIHAVSDGLAAIALMVIAVLLVAIAMLNTRFVIRGRLEDDVRQIGVMKAIGLPHRAISRLYLGRYLGLTAVGCVIGGALAVMAVPMLTEGVQLHYAAAGVSGQAVAALLLSVAAVASVVIASCHKALGRVRKVQVVDALVHGSVLDAKRAARRNRRLARQVRRTSLTSAPGGSINRRIALLELRADAGQWLLVPVVFFLAAVLMSLPAHLLSTVSSPALVTSMGAPEADVVVNLQHTEDLDALRTAVVTSMQDDGRLSDVQVFAQILLEVDGAHGWQTMRVEIGDYSGPTIDYTVGGPPGPGEIALSVLNAQRHGVAPGDELGLRTDGGETSAVVAGVYNDLTSGGYTAKMQGEPSDGATGYVVYADVADGTDPVALAAEYDERFPGAAVLPMKEYAEQTLSHVTGALGGAAVLACAFGLGIAGLITGMFLQLRMTRERRAMGTKSAIGFSTAEILAQVRGKALAGAVTGALLGAVTAILLGGPFISVLMGMTGLGMSSLQLVPNLPLAIIYAVTLMATGWAVARAATARFRDTDTATWLRA